MEDLTDVRFEVACKYHFCRSVLVIKHKTCSVIIFIPNVIGKFVIACVILLLLQEFKNWHINK